MQEWETYRQAALEYSKLKPRRSVGSITLTEGVQTYALPADCMTVTFVAWGDEGSYLEVVTAAADSTVQGWAAEAGELHITPAPTATDVATPIKIVYNARHIGDEDTQEFATIPAADVPYVEDLEQAIILDLEADDVARGPAIYTIGQTQVSRAEALNDLRSRALQLRSRVRAALDEPFATWA